MKGRLLAIVLPIAACMAWGSALSQPLEEIVVEASPIIKERAGDKTAPAPGYYKVMMSSRVSYADLDLAKSTDVATLEWRINEAAKVVCEKLGKAYPDSGPEAKECAKRAADKAMTEAKKIIAAKK
jgi:UrcA family protein